MDTWLWWVIGVAVVVGAVFALPYLAQRSMDDAGAGGTGGNAFGVLQEIFHPAAHRAEASIVEQQRKEQPTPEGEPEDPDDPDHRTRSAKPS